MVKKYPQNPILGTISNHYFFDSVMLEASERDASLSSIDEVCERFGVFEMLFRLTSDDDNRGSVMQYNE